jgi:hypothetical protein
MNDNASTFRMNSAQAAKGLRLTLHHLGLNRVDMAYSYKHFWHCNDNTTDKRLMFCRKHVIMSVVLFFVGPKKTWGLLKANKNCQVLKRIL